MAYVCRYNSGSADGNTGYTEENTNSAGNDGQRAEPVCVQFYRRTEGEKNSVIQDGTDSPNDGRKAFAEGAVQAFLEVKIREAAWPGRISSLDLSGLKLRKTRGGD